MKKFVAVLSCVLVLSGGFFAYDKLANNSAEPTTLITHADYPHYEDIGSLSDVATDIVMGRIVDERVERINTVIPSTEQDETLNPSGEVEENAVIYTVYTLLVSNVYKGEHESGEYIEIKQLGGEIDNVNHMSEDTLALTTTNEYVFFLESYENVPASILNPFQSAYIFDSRAKSPTAKLISVNQDNDLSLTYADLLKIQDR